MRTISNRSARTSPSGVRGFTLLELIVVAGISLVIFAFLIRWVMTLGTVSDNTLSQAQAARATQAVDYALAADTAQTTTCANMGQIRTLNDSVLELYVTASFLHMTNETHLVRYQVANGSLTRTEYVMDPDNGICNPSGPGLGQRVIADGVSETGTVFAATRDGAHVGTCETSPIEGADEPGGYESAGDGCSATGVEVTLTGEPHGKDGGRDTLQRSYTFAQSGGAL